MQTWKLRLSGTTSDRRKKSPTIMHVRQNWGQVHTFSGGKKPTSFAASIFSLQYIPNAVVETEGNYYMAVLHSIFLYIL